MIRKEPPMIVTGTQLFQTKVEVEEALILLMYSKRSSVVVAVEAEEFSRNYLVVEVEEGGEKSIIAVLICGMIWRSL